MIDITAILMWNSFLAAPCAVTVADALRCLDARQLSGVSQEKVDKIVATLKGRGAGDQAEDQGGDKIGGHAYSSFERRRRDEGKYHREAMRS